MGGGRGGGGGRGWGRVGVQAKERGGQGAHSNNTLVTHCITVIHIDTSSSRYSG